MACIRRADPDVLRHAAAGFQRSDRPEGDGQRWPVFGIGFVRAQYQCGKRRADCRTRPSPVAATENTPVQIFGFNVADVEGDLLTVHLNAPSAMTLASISGLIGLTGNGTSSISFSGTAANINHRLERGMTYVPTSDFQALKTSATASAMAFRPPSPA